MAFLTIAWCLLLLATTRYSLFFISYAVKQMKLCFSEFLDEVERTTNNLSRAIYSSFFNDEAFLDSSVFFRISVVLARYIQY